MKVYSATENVSAENSRRALMLQSINSHWFRRMVHVSCACTLIYYLFPDSILWIYAAKIILASGIFFAAVVIEIIRLKGTLDEGFLFPFRDYEKSKVGAHIWLGISALVLLVFFPQQIAAPCILAVCLADPVVGELRMKNKAIGFFCGFCISTAIFVVFNYPIMLCSLAGLLAVSAESIRSKNIDDNILMPLVPAVILLAAFQCGLFALPAPAIIPFCL